MGRRVGVLALQGDFLEHCTALRGLAVTAREVRLPRDLDEVEALIIPGGESTTISRLLTAYDLAQPVKERVRGGMPLWGTCAGMIVAARDVPDLDREPLGLIDISVRRNAFGRQVDSFEEDLPVAALGAQPFHAIFIRAPLIEKTGPGVETLARLRDGTTVAARQGNVLVTAFHPELTEDPRFHNLFLSLIPES
jgi:5'-phosphate synthase pdxT subunit